MERILIIKTGALGDVVRTTPLLHRYRGEVFWLTSEAGMDLLPLDQLTAIITPAQFRKLGGMQFDTVISLEEDKEILSGLNQLRYDRLIGVYYDADGDLLCYTDDSSPWYDMSMISRYGKAEADRRKLSNRKSYQEILFEMLGWTFRGEEYLINYSPSNSYSADGKQRSPTVAIERRAGSRWPMKQWKYYPELKSKLEAQGLTVYYLHQRERLLQYIADIDRCDILVCGDTLAMHIGLYLRKKVVALFTCTSPWEIYDYGRMTKIISPRLEEAFYRRDYNEDLASAIAIEDVYASVMKMLHGAFTTHGDRH